jgi:diadenosine tetraphosphate (Ap4A) HIT family hydrolase
MTDEMTAMTDEVAAAMEQLAAALRARGFRVMMDLACGGVPHMTVHNPAAARLSETIIGHAGAFWWSWREQIAPVSDVTTAAAVIARVLATADEVPSSPPRQFSAVVCGEVKTLAKSGCT